MTKEYLFIIWMMLIAPIIGRAQKVTFTEHIAPIIHQNCSPCHRPGESGPFPLITYQEVSKRASFIQHVTEARYMPPWRADRHYQSYANEKGLSQVEIDLIEQWVEQGALKGPRRKMPELPQFPEGSQIGIPDMRLSVQQAFPIPGDNSEQFVLFVIPFEMETAQSVRAIEFVGGNKSLLHHVNFGFYEVGTGVDIYGDIAPIATEDMAQHANRFRALSQNLVFYNGWIPGSSPIIFPKGTGFVMPKRGVIMLTAHYGPSAVAASDSSLLNIFFGEDPQVRSIKTLNMGSAGIGTITPPLTIPANEKTDHQVRITTKRAMSMLYVWPHMHLIGQDFKAYAVPPSGDTIPLVQINRWDFNWQEAYQFDHLLKIPAGSVLAIEGSYDNTADNPDNPFDPPQTIRSNGLMRTQNEMLSLILIYLDYESGDELREME